MNPRQGLGMSGSLQNRLSGITRTLQSSSPVVRHTNAELLTKARTGTTAGVRSVAAAALRQRLVGLVWSVSSVHVGLTQEDREDLVQDVLIKLISNTSISAPHPAYIQRIVTNLLIDKHRHASSRGLLSKVFNSDEILSVYAETVAIPEPAAEQYCEIDSLLSVLSQREHMVVVARMAGTAYSEIAVTLDITPVSVRKIHERAIGKVRGVSKACV